MKLSKAKTIFQLFGFLLISPSAEACWKSLPPIRIANDHLNVRLTYLGKPLSGEFVLLRNRKRNVSLQSKVDEQGWVRFAKVPAGDYRLVTSHEDFEVVLTRSSANSTAIFISFSADFADDCPSVSLRNDPTFPDFDS